VVSLSDGEDSGERYFIGERSQRDEKDAAVGEKHGYLFAA